MPGVCPGGGCLSFDLTGTLAITPHVTSKRKKLLNPGFQGFFWCTFPLVIFRNKVKVNSKELIEHRVILFPITNADNERPTTKEIIILKTAAKVPRREYYIAQSIHNTRTFIIFIYTLEKL